MNLEKRISEARERAFIFLENINISSDSNIKRTSTFHDVSIFPDMLLPGTYNGNNCQYLIEGKVSEKKKNEVIDFINSFQDPNDGYYKFKEMKDYQICKESNPGKNIRDTKYVREYINFHLTNYAMSTINLYGRKPKYPFKFIRNFINKSDYNIWFSNRNWHDPWCEGNFIVNLASFFIQEWQNENCELSKERLSDMLIWHKNNQDPRTGFWGTNISGEQPTQLYGMAGGCHNLHIYYYFGEKFLYMDKIVDYCINFAKQGLRSACLDIDVVDVLVNIIVYGYRVPDILRVLHTMLYRLLEFQNLDGGFADTKTKSLRRFDSWVGGYWEPQGISNCFATWFRMATIGMIECILYPENAKRWHFRNTIGIGYFNSNYLKE